MTTEKTARILELPSGAKFVVDTPAGGTGAVAVLLHGAGSGTGVPVLRALADRLLGAGLTVGRLEQAYRVAGRRFPDRPDRLDAALREAVATLPVGDGPLLLAGRSSGARVACRTARAAGATAVVALGFPLQPPGGRSARTAELAGAGVPVLVVQGSRDAFGMPAADPRAGREVHVVQGADHVLTARRVDGRTSAECLDEAVLVATGWLLAHAGPARG